MHDEATPEYKSVIDQMTAGQEFLWDNFGVIPKVGWQIDSHGHAPSTPSLFSMLGLDTLITSKIGDEVKADLTKNSNLNLVWQGHKIGENMEKHRILLHPTPNNFHIDFPFGFVTEEEFH